MPAAQIDRLLPGPAVPAGGAGPRPRPGPAGTAWTRLRRRAAPAPGRIGATGSRRMSGTASGSSFGPPYFWASSPRRRSGAARNRRDVAPSAVAGTVQIDPGDQPIPGLRVQLHVVVALLQHLHQFARVGVVLARHVQPHVVLDIHAADQRDQRLVGGRVPHLAIAEQLVLRLCRAERFGQSRNSGSSRLAPNFDSGSPGSPGRKPFGPQVGDLPRRRRAAGRCGSRRSTCPAPAAPRARSRNRAAVRTTVRSPRAVAWRRCRDASPACRGAVRGSRRRTAVSPGMAVYQLRINASALPSASSG